MIIIANNIENSMEEFISKSQKKSYADCVQNVGVTLKFLSPEVLDTIPISDSLRKALLQIKEMKNDESARRQAQLIGKLMRSSDVNAIFDVCDALFAQGKINPSLFKELAEWRRKLKSMPIPPRKDPARAKKVRPLYPVLPTPAPTGRNTRL